ncbi:hypothetical protein CASFOL_019937 [Castilleja foliolosa]|uniref:peroxidase n=1 Tax=Castilleja foliolosa TaxID=1961234 RepID=A0ABD3CZE5_9LAMI
MSMTSRVLLLSLLHLATAAVESQLTLDCYKKTCPQFADIIQQVVADKKLAIPTTTVGTLSLFLHDCIVGGCDASLLISSNSFNQAERDNHLNMALPGDAFDFGNQFASIATNLLEIRF